MLPSGSNALLKTLEEPNEDTYFLFYYPPSRHLLLPTIISRLYPLQFNSTALPSTDFSPYIALASQGEWDKLLDELPEECPEDFMKSCLQWAAQQKNPAYFLKVSGYVRRGRQASSTTSSLEQSF